MDRNPIKVLLIEDNPGDARLFREFLAQGSAADFEVIHTDRLSTGLERLTARDIDVILLDLGLPDSQGLDTFTQVHTQAMNTPIVVVTALDDENLALKAVHAGAQDYLTKGQVNSILLSRAIHYAIERKRMEDEVKRQSEELAVLYVIATAVSQSLDLGVILDTALKETLKALNADGGVISLFDKAGQTFTPVAHQNISKEVIQEIAGFKLGEGLFGRVAKTVQPLVVSDLGADPRSILPASRNAGLNSYASVPIESRGKSIGVMTLVSHSKDLFGQDNIRLLGAIGNRIGVAVENARLYEQSQTRRSHLEILQRVNASLRSMLPLSQVLEMIVESTGEAFECIGSLILVPDATDEQLILGAVSGRKFINAIRKVTKAGVDVFRLPISVGENPINRAYRTGEIHITSGAPEQVIIGVEPVINPKMAKGIARVMGAKLAVCVSLLAGDEVAGVLVAIFPRETLTEDERIMLLGLADQAGIAIENARMFDRVRSGREWLRALARRVLTAQEDERRRLSHELHDESGQALTALKITLEMIRDDLPDHVHDLRQRVDEAVALTDTTIEGIRLLSRALRPPALDALGLNPTLEAYCQEFDGRAQLTIDYIGAELPTLSDEVNITFYRLLQEALTNVVKHAQADRVRVTLDYDGEAVSLSVEDNGRGFRLGADATRPTESMGIGILGMRERLQAVGGMLEIESQPGKGARLVSRIPLKEVFLESR